MSWPIGFGVTGRGSPRGVTRRPCARAWLALALAGSVGCSTPATWTERGPALGGRLTGIVATGTGGSVLLVASPGGGVWRSTNGGASWTFPAHFGMGDYSFVHLEWDVVTPGRLYGLTWNGLYATTDNGDSWTALVGQGGVPAPLQPDDAAASDRHPFAQLKFSPTERLVLASRPCGGLFYSFDGTTFTQHWPFPSGSSNLDNCIGAIAADPVSRRVYFATLNRDAFGPAHVFRSNCGASTWGPGTPCLTWEAANGGLPNNAVIAGMTSISGGALGDQLVGQESVTGATRTYLTINGLTWTLQSTLPNPSWAPRPLVYTGFGRELFHGNVLAHHTLDLANWTTFNVPSQHPDVRAIYPDATAGRVWTVTDGSDASGVYANVTRWTWKPGAPPVPGSGADLGHNGLTIWQAYYAGIVATTSTSSPRRVFVGSQDNSTLCSDSLGQAGWTTSGAPATPGDAFALQIAPSDPNRVYAWSNDPLHFARTLNAAGAANCAGVTWATVTPQQDPPGSQLIAPRYWSRKAIAVHPTNPDRLYFALDHEVGVSANAGAATPLVSHRPLPESPAYRATTIYVDAAGAIYVGTVDHGAFKSTDDGQSWSPWGLNAGSPAMVTAITRSGGATPTFWMATTDGLYKGTATGGPWSSSHGGGGYIVGDVAVDPNCPTRVYAAFGFGGWRAQHRGGIDFTSTNGGSWTSITSGTALHQSPVADVEVDPSQPTRVYTASYGRGFWVYDWGTMLPACVP